VSAARFISFLDLDLSFEEKAFDTTALNVLKQKKDITSRRKEGAQVMIIA
jgi:hypothetical protein